MRTVHITSDSVWRRGAVAVLAAVSLLVILGFGALAIDLGQLYLARAELQRAGDAAALAGASAYFSDAGLARDHYVLEAMIDERAQRTSYSNPTHRESTYLELADIIPRVYDPENPDVWLYPTWYDRLNAVQVTVRRTPESTNGSIALYLAGVLGIRDASVTATATAMANDAFGGLDLEPGLHPSFIPITVNVHLYKYLTLWGPDDYSCEDDVVYDGPDGIRELNLYSWRVNPNNLDDPYDDVIELMDQGAGNFALLRFDANNIHDVEENIEHGLTTNQLIGEFGTSTLRYYTESGDPITYQLTGEQGLRVSLAEVFSERIGDVVGIFLHDEIIEYGGADEYENVGVRFGRIMESDLLGTDDKLLVFQPVAYTGSDVIVCPGVPATWAQIGRVVLVK